MPVTLLLTVRAKFYCGSRNGGLHSFELGESPPLHPITLHNLIDRRSLHGLHHQHHFHHIFKRLFLLRWPYLKSMSSSWSQKIIWKALVPGLIKIIMPHAKSLFDILCPIFVKPVASVRPFIPPSIRQFTKNLNMFSRYFIRSIGECLKKRCVAKELPDRTCQRPYITRI